MTSSTEIIVKYLEEAKAMEASLESVLVGQIALTPSGRYRSRLERHLSETREHAARLGSRLDELGAGPGPLARGLELAETVVGRTIAVGKLPIDLLRGASGEDAVLKNAKEVCATEALEIAAYRALEQIAEEIGDGATAQLAREICAEEEAMLHDILETLPALATEVVDAQVTAHGTYDVTDTRTAEAEAVAKAAVPGDLPIGRYDERSADEIAARLSDLSQVDLAKIDVYERRHQGRVTVLSRIEALRAHEPWPGYDELTVAEVQARLGALDEDSRAGVRSYERRHKNRRGVIAASERSLAPAS